MTGTAASEGKEAEEDQVTDNFTTRLSPLFHISQDLTTDG